MPLPHSFDEIIAVAEPISFSGVNPPCQSMIRACSLDLRDLLQPVDGPVCDLRTTLARGRFHRLAKALICIDCGEYPTV